MFDLLVFTIGAVLALVLSVCLGLERELRNKPAGIKTHAFIGVGAYAFSYLSFHVATDFPFADPTRIAAQIVTGIGFIGAGAILQAKGQVRGLTTAATLWIAAAIGTLVGAMHFGAGIVLTVLTLLFLFFSSWLFRGLPRPICRTVYIQMGDISAVSAIGTVLDVHPVKVIKREFSLDKPLQVSFLLSGTPLAFRLLVGQLRIVTGVDTVVLM